MVMTVSEKQLQAMLENPPKPSPKLLEAIERRMELYGE